MSGNFILNYFDLNRRVETDSFLDIPDDPDSPSIGLSKKKKKLPPIPLWKQLIFYLFTALGVVLSSSILAWQTGKTPTITVTITTLILSAFVALLVMPQTYEKVLKHDAPFFAQLGIFVQQGVFWSLLLTTIGKLFG